MKLCECGCGNPAPLSKYAHRGYRVGDPLRFVKGHRKASAETKARQRASMMARPRPDPLIRFWANVDKSGPVIKPELGPCWIWKGVTDHKGYSKMKVDGRNITVHRWFYELTHEPIPRHLVSDHLCRNHGCVNPSHIDPVTSRVNTQRGNSGQWQRETTHCPLGHEYTEENTYMYRGSRNCRSCRKISWRQRNERFKIERRERKESNNGRNITASCGRSTDITCSADA